MSYVEGKVIVISIVSLSMFCVGTWIIVLRPLTSKISNRILDSERPTLSRRCVSRGLFQRILTLGVDGVGDKEDYGILHKVTLDW